MSSMDNIEPPIIKKSLGSLHPVNQTKDFLLYKLEKKKLLKKYKVKALF